MRLDTLTIKSTRTEVVAAPKTGTGAAPMVKSLTDRITGAAPVVERAHVTAPKFSYALTIVGSTTKNSDVADFLASLKASPILQGMELTYIREAKEKDKELRKFEINASIRTDTETEVLAGSLRKLIAERTAVIESGGKAKDGLGPAVPAVTADGTGKAGS